MSHPRRVIRNAIAARLVDGTIAGPRVFAGRPAPVEEGELPAIVIHTREQEEIVDYPTSGWQAQLVRKCYVMVEGIMQSFDDIDDELDDFAQQIEGLMEAFEIPGMESSEIRLDTTQSEIDWEAGLSTGAIRLRYSVVYRTPFRMTPDPYVTPWDAAWDETQIPEDLQVVKETTDAMPRKGWIKGPDGEAVWGELPAEYSDQPELNIYRSGAYPGGQVKPDGQTGEACPTGDAQLFHQEEPIN